MIGLSITVAQDAASPALRQLLQRLTPQRFAAAIGPASAKLFRNHFRSLGTNKQGWPSTGFWRDAANATSWQPASDGVTISVAKIGVRQRLQGGDISPVNAKALTIPLSPEAYGHTAGDFPGAFLLKTKTGAYIVQYGGSITGTGKGQKHAATFNFLFKLMGGVHQEPDPTVIPTDDEIRETAIAALTRAIGSDSQPSTD